jgi:hypothetical protein
LAIEGTFIIGTTMAGTEAPVLASCRYTEERRNVMTNPLRKLVILLALLTAFLGSLSTFTVRKAHAIPCCSACDRDPIPNFCRFGCSESC